MTPARKSSKVGQRRQSRAVASRSGDAVATRRLTVKFLLWAAFFAALFTVHAHVGIRTATLLAQANRLQGQVETMREEQRRLRHEILGLEANLSASLDPGGADDTLSFAECAQQRLGMITPAVSERLTVDPSVISEVREAAPLWALRRTPGGPSEMETASAGWIETLAGLWADHDIQG